LKPLALVNEHEQDFLIGSWGVYH